MRARRTTDRASLLTLAALVVGSGCQPPPATPPSVPFPALLTDTNPDPQVVEVQLVAGPATMEYLPGKPAQVWAYRDGAIAGEIGSVPGPLLVANQGDMVIIHLRNELPVSTTLHVHGPRLPPAQDGTPAAQVAIPPGGTFDYRFTASDAGSFWYHPHVEADEQIEKGLQGPLLVRGGTAVDVAADRYFVLDDVKVQADGTLATAIDRLDIMLGRQGNVLLVNGRRGGRLDVAAGTRERWRFVNAANGRYFNLSLPGHRFLVIGWDGGLLPEPYGSDTLLVAPGERYEVLVTFDAPPAAGRPLALRTLHYDRGHDIPDPGPKDLFEVAYGPAGAAPAPLPASWRKLTPLAVEDATPLRTFELQEAESPAGTQFLINGERWPFNTSIKAKAGDVEIWEIRANAEMDHPFHLHGTFFEVLSVDGIAPPHFGWKDTVNVPRGTRLRFAVRHAPGRWMYHCHILEHAERGMMGELMVE